MRQFEIGRELTPLSNPGAASYMLSEKHEGVMSIRERVNAFLTAQYPSRFCDDCICERLELSQRKQVREVTSALGTTDCFRRALDVCS